MHSLYSHEADTKLESAMCPSSEGYRKAGTGRPKLPAKKRKDFKGTIRFDAALDSALREEQKRREQAGEKSDQATVMRSLIIKSLKDLGHDVSE
tara:strand:- start:185 stop:466 length:282 start_codon:yes stop_codon:yes gene_type:complete